MPLLTEVRVRGVLRSEGGRGVRWGGSGPIGGRGGGLGFSCSVLLFDVLTGNLWVSSLVKVKGVYSHVKSCFCDIIFDDTLPY